MQYIGGKNKSGGSQIAQLVNTTIRARALSVVSEPFCGGLSVTSRLVAPRVVASDACAALITLYRCMQAGWRPPDLLPHGRWLELRARQDPTDPMTAFAGFGCSRSGAWYASFVEHNRRNAVDIPAALAARESLENKLRPCTRVEFIHCDYRSAPEAELYYCDKPYEGTMSYPAVPGPFDHRAFWAWARVVSRRALLVVSERKAPHDFRPLLTISLQNRLNTDGGRRTESVFVHESQFAAWECG